MTSRPSLSVVTAVYNGEKYLAEAIESILNQTYSDFDYILVNDGSTDKTADILSHYQREDQRIRVSFQAHCGLAATRNRLFELARGTYVAILDADDIAFPDRLARQMSFLANHPEAALVGGAIVRINNDGTVIDTGRYPLRDDQIKSAMISGNPFAQSAVVIKHAAFRAVGGYRKCFAPTEDYDLWIRLGERYPLANLPEPVVYYRIHQDQISQKAMEQQVIGHLAAVAAWRLRREGKADPTDGAESLDPETLAELGISTQLVKEHSLKACVGRVKMALKAGDASQAIVLARKALARSPPTHIRRALETSFHWAKIRVHAKRREWALASRHFVPFSGRPWLALRTVWRDVRYRLRSSFRREQHSDRIKSPFEVAGMAGDHLRGPARLTRRRQAPEDAENHGKA